MARIAFLSLILATGLAWSDQQVVNGLINSDQTYIVNDQGESLQEYGVGQLVYVVIDSKDSKDKKRKDFYRVTFDPTNLKGDGWVLREKVKLMTAYHSIDGKEPKEYDNKPQPMTAQRGGAKGSTMGNSGTSEASTFLEELVKKDEQKPDLKPVTAQPKATAEVKKPADKNPLENDLEFLFQQDGEFKQTFKETKASLKQSMQKKVGVSKFSNSSFDAFANKVMDQFTAKVQKSGKLASVPHFEYVANLEDASAISKMSIAPDLDGVFFGQLSPKIGEARLLKVKYYDKKLKQFTFEKVAKVPLTNPTLIVEKLANDCYQFVSK